MATPTAAGGIVTRIYLDNAATSYPKPPEVWDAVDRYQRQVGAPVGRGSSRAAGDMQATAERGRRRPATRPGAPDAKHVVFTSNGTDSLTLALSGILQPGDHVVTTVLEHNSVLRPLRNLHDTRGVDVTFVSPNDRGLIEPSEVRAALQHNT